jgi:hypothetical protein
VSSRHEDPAPQRSREGPTRADSAGPPEILSVRRFGRDELLAALRRTPLRGYGGAAPYQDARLELASAVDPATLAPAQRYVLMPRVRALLRLREALLAHGIDLLALDGGVHIRTSEDPATEVPIAPPFVEDSRERDGRRVLLINDGLHRVFAARSVGLPVSVVIARGVPARYPYYAFALSDGWSQVAELQELPDEYQKKEYRLPGNYKALFRDFNAVLPGIQQERKKSNPAHLRA